MKEKKEGTMSFTANASLERPKIYCRDCKYDTMLGKVIGHEYNTKTGRTDRKFCSPYDHNENNNCEYFKRKWWKRFFDLPVSKKNKTHSKTF